MLILLLLATVSSEICTPVECGDLPSNQCFMYKNNLAQVSSCDPNQVCNITSLSSPINVTCTDLQTPTRYPGDLCSYNSQCTSGLCSDKICSGPGFQQPCTVEIGCSPGFYCLNNLCQNQVRIGGLCMSDTDCVNNALCNLGKCIQYWSLVNNEPTIAPINSLSLACKSGAAKLTISGYTCSPAEDSESLETTCDIGSLCYSSSKTYSSPCVCGKNTYGQGYCPLFSGDSQVQSAIIDSSLVFKNNSLCGSYSRFSINCFALYPSLMPGFLNFSMNFTLAFKGYYALTRNNTDCINMNLNQEYYEIVNALGALQEPALCPAFYCDENATEWVTDQCVLGGNDLNFGVVTDIYYTKYCPSNMYCNAMMGFYNATCQIITESTSYPGDFCNKSSDCSSGRCQENFCLGIREDEQCSSLSDCQPGLFCNTTRLRCQPLRKKFESCISIYECSNTLICNGGICINYFSLQNGEIVDTCNGGLAMSCSSGFAVYNKGICTCQPAPLSARIDTCTYPGQTCFDSSGKHNKTCQCSSEPAANGITRHVYCPPFIGDIYFQNAMINFLNLLNWNQVCNTISRFKETCYLRSNEYLGYYYYYITNMTFYLNYASVYNVPPCVMQAFAYEEYQNEIKLSAWIKKNSNNGSGGNDDDQGSVLRYITGILIFSISF
ncbi:hypothetical protein SteCoe_28528 [Stentor coeruleus]|uniref:Uncharacterized protein n=1 Tax=Stentor coeruleus TaxID=5963 RepID=A0A1R2B821_9CILI|nr:hypothetical protein SteCoe_28528 [Stentor coeruleus]